VALREAEEESGLNGLVPVSNEIFDLDAHPIPARPNEPAHRHYDVRFAFRATASEAFIVSDESNQLAWIKISEMATVSNEESMLRMARKWRSNLA
jgi:8-oxo-dGTP pyrophosphatase MutT (NUDIX family)